MRHKYSGNAAADYYLDMMEERDMQIEAEGRYFEENSIKCDYCGEIVLRDEIKRNLGYCDNCIITGRFLED